MSSKMSTAEATTDNHEGENNHDEEDVPDWKSISTSSEWDQAVQGDMEHLDDRTLTGMIIEAAREHLASLLADGEEIDKDNIFGGFQDGVDKYYDHHQALGGTPGRCALIDTERDWALTKAAKRCYNSWGRAGKRDDVGYFHIRKHVESAIGRAAENTDVSGRDRSAAVVTLTRRQLAREAKPDLYPPSESESESESESDDDDDDDEYPEWEQLSCHEEDWYEARWTQEQITEAMAERGNARVDMSDRLTTDRDIGLTFDGEPLKDTDDSTDDDADDNADDDADSDADAGETTLVEDDRAVDSVTAANDETLVEEQTVTAEEVQGGDKTKTNDGGVEGAEGVGSAVQTKKRKLAGSDNGAESAKKGGKLL